jgi:hypothetical protein
MTHPPDPAIESRLARLESMLSPDGTVRCERLLVMDAHGTPRIVASVSPSGEAMLEWLDSGKVRRVMVAARADGSAGMLVSDAEARPRLALGTDARGGAHLACVDAAGRPRITVGTASPDNPDAAAAVALIDDLGGTRISLRSINGDALLTFADREKRVRLSAGTFADGTVAVPSVAGEAPG